MCRRVSTSSTTTSNSAWRKSTNSTGHPQGSTHSAGFTFFRVKAEEDQDRFANYLIEHRVMVDAVYRDAGPVIRTAPGLLNDEQELDRTLALLKRTL